MMMAGYMERNSLWLLQKAIRKMGLSIYKERERVKVCPHKQQPQCVTLQDHTFWFMSFSSDGKSFIVAIPGGRKNSCMHIL